MDTFKPLLEALTGETPLSELLDHLSTLDHRPRVQYLVKLGQQSLDTSTASGKTVSAFIAQLSAPSACLYNHHLALYAHYGTRDLSLALSILERPSSGLAGLAMKQIGELGTKDQQLQALRILPSRRQGVFLAKLARLGKKEVLDQWVKTLVDEGWVEKDVRRVTRAMQWASDDVVAEILNDEAVLERFEGHDWYRLAGRHPDICHSKLKDLISSNTNGQDQGPLLHTSGWSMGRLSRSTPDKALELVTILLKQHPLRSVPIGDLVNKRPVEMARILISEDEQSSVTIGKRIRKLPTDLLVNLISTHPQYFDEAHSLKHLSYDNSRALYKEMRIRWQKQDSLPRLSVIKDLPPDLRIAEARQYLRRCGGMHEIEYQALLPWEEAITKLKPYIQSGDADKRCMALTELLASVRFQYVHLGEALDLVIDRRYDQDPVRQSMFAGLNRIPGAAFKRGNLDQVEIILRHGLEAKDLSNPSQMVKLLLKLLLWHPDWASRQIALVMRDHPGAFHDLRLTDINGPFSHAVGLKYLIEALLPVVHENLQRNTFFDSSVGVFCVSDSLVGFIRLAELLGRRLADTTTYSKLLDDIEQAVLDSQSWHEANQVLCILGNAAPDRLLALVPRALEKDETFIALALVQKTLARHLQTHLTPFHTPKKLHGRFEAWFQDGDSSSLLILHFGAQSVERWTPNMQKAYQKMLVNALEDPSLRDVYSAKCDLDALVNLSYVDPKPLIQFADENPPSRQVLRDHAISLLSRLEGARGLGTLLECLEDSRARFAIYGIRRLMLELPDEAAVRTLTGVRSEKITVAKEVARLIGEFKIESAFVWLKEMAGREVKDKGPLRKKQRTQNVPVTQVLTDAEKQVGLSDAEKVTLANQEKATLADPSKIHIDVLIAVHRGLWRFLDRPDTWSIFAQSAASPNPDLGRALTTIPIDGLPKTTKKCWLALMASLLKHPNREVREAALQRLSDAKLRDPEGVLREELLRIVTAAKVGDTERVKAAQAGVAVYAVQEPNTVGQMIKGLLDNKKALELVFRAVKQRLIDFRHEQIDPLVSAMLKAFRLDPLTSPLRYELIVQHLRVTETVAHLPDLAYSAHPDLLHKLQSLIPSFAGRMSATVELLDSLERDMANDPDSRARRIGLTLLCELVKKSKDGWSAEMRQRLEEYRMDGGGTGMVAEAAAWTFPSYEDDDEEDLVEGDYHVSVSGDRRE